MNQYEKFAYDRDWYYQKKNVKPISEEKFEELFNSGKIVWAQTNLWREPLALCRADGYPDRDWQTQKKWTDERISYLNFYA